MIATRTVKSGLPVILAFHVLLCVNTADVRAQTADSPDAQVDTAPVEEELTDIDLLDLEIPTVVTAARREQKITDVAHAVSVITAEDIRWAGARSVPDALRLVPGVDIAQLAYGNAAVSPRGFHGFFSNSTLVLVDGRQIYDALYGGTLWGNWPFQIEDIERIEVIRGPAGVTWGANTVNGVINIITKDPADQLGLTVTGGGGSRGTHKEYLGYGFSDGKLKLRVSGEYEASDGFREGGSVIASLDDSYKSGRMAIHGVYDAGPQDTLTLSAGSALVDNGYPPMPIPAAPRQNAGTQASFFLGRWRHEADPDNAFELTSYVNDFAFDAGISVAQSRYQQLGLLFGHTYKPTSNHTLNWGIDTRVDLLDATQAAPAMLSKDHIHSAVVGLYLQDEWRFAPKWTLNLGGRIDYESYSGFQPSARVALSYDLSEDSLVYASVSRSFQMPTAAVRFTGTPFIGGLIYATGDRDMKAMSQIAYQLGYRGIFFDRLQAGVNLYWHEHTDAIGMKPLPGPPGILRANMQNIGSFTTYGIELDTKYAVTDEFTLLGHYTFQRINWRSSFPFVFSGDFITPPKHKFMIVTRYSPTDDVHLSSHLYYVDSVRAPNPSMPLLPRHVEPYFRLDLRAEHEFWNDRASIAVGVRNLLDSGHYEGATWFFNDAEVPRMAYAEMRMRLD